MIDSSIINNYNGSELTQKKYYDLKHKATKLSVISTKKGIPLIAECYKCNTHDVKTVKSGLTKLKNKYKIKNVNLIGDKGYIMKKNDKNTSKNIIKHQLLHLTDEIKKRKIQEKKKNYFPKDIQ